MNDKLVSGDCENCESSYQIAYTEQFVSSELPEHCPFCGELIEDISEEYIDEEDGNEDEQEWD